MREKYKLVGVLNYFDVVPGFTLPVFEGSNKKMYIFTCGDDLPSFSDSYLVGLEELSLVRPLDSFKNLKKDIDKDTFSLGEEAIMSFCLDEDTIYIASLDKMLEFLENYQTDNQNLMEQVEDNKKEIMIRKGYTINHKLN